jgi:hypothetical protein
MPIKTIGGLLLLAFLSFMIPTATPAQIAVGVSVHIGPPALPVYAQPICPGAGYLWTPGYWAYGPDSYYWVPGTWVIAPTPGFLWTPGYWGWGGGAYFWHGGYWGPHVGFYGGINYGFGYGGVGFYGGEWRGGVYHYNTAVTNVNTTVIHNTYVNNTVINNNTTVNRTSFNGGTGGVMAQPTAAEQAAAREQHVPATSLQTQHEQAARSDRTMLASANHGQPAVAATPKPGVFHGAGVVAARPASVSANHSTNSVNNNHNAAVQNDRPPSARANATTSSTNANHPNTATQNYSQHMQTSTGGASGGSHPNTSNVNTNHAKTPPTNNNHPNNAKPPQNHAQPPHEHEGGHPGGRSGR